MGWTVGVFSIGVLLAILLLTGGAKLMIEVCGVREKGLAGAERADLRVIGLGGVGPTLLGLGDLGAGLDVGFFDGALPPFDLIASDTVKAQARAKICPDLEIVLYRRTFEYSQYDS